MLIELIEKKVRNLKYWTSSDIEKDRYLTPPEKIRREKIDKILTEKSLSRDSICWCYGCNAQAKYWVREIQYDFKQMKASIDHAIVSTLDYTGPVPGFCYSHISNGPKQLAEAVYFARKEMYWGLRPNRWWVIFTDGIKTGGLCKEIDIKQEMPEITEELITS